MRARRENAKPSALRRVLACLVSAAMVVAFTPVVAWGGETSTYYVLPSDPSNHISQNATEVTADYLANTNYTLKAGWYVVKGPNLEIGSSADKKRVTINGDVHLILADGCNLTVNGGIQVEGSSSLAIYGQSLGTGKLDTSSTSDAGIGGGGGGGGSSGSVTISGGVVTATSTASAGIGGGDGGGSGNVTISGGVVTATSTDSAGIGGGDGVSISGNAVVFASTKATDPNSKAISDTSGKAENASNPWSGVIFENGQGAVYGSSAIEPTESFTIPAGKTLTIESGKKLAIASGKALVNEGTINNSGSIANSGLFVDFGTSDISPETGRVITKPQAASSLVYGGQAQALAQESASSAGYIQYKLGQDGSWSKEIPTATDHGEYTVYYQAVNSSGQAISSEFPLSASIAQREVGIQWGSTSLTYTGQAQAPTATATNAVDSDAIALTVEGAQTDVSANAYTATVTAITGDKAANYKLPAATTTSFTIGKAASGLTTAPAARTDLVYSGSAQELVSAGAATGGTMQYKLGGSGSWSAEVPTATAASTYTVYYYVKGDANHEDSQEGCVSVTIAKAAPSVTPPAANRQLTYSGSAQELVTAGSSADGTMQYSLDGTVWSTDLPAETNAGTYTVLYKVVGDSNHASIDPTPIEVTIAKKAVTVSGITAAGKTYDGTTGATLSFAGVIIDGKVGNDSLGVTATGTFADANAGDNKQVDITGIALEGDAAGNYVLAETGQQTKASASINRKEVTATITAGGGTYAGTITPAGATLNGVVSGDSVPVTLTYTGSANDGTPYNSTTAPSLAGSYTVTASISDANYKLTGTANAAFTIAKASTSVGIAASKDKLSGGGSVTLAVDSSQLPLGAQASVSCSDASIAVTPNGDGTFTASLPNATKDYTFTASYSGDDNHNEASGSCAVAVTQYIPPAPTYTVPVTGEDSVEVKATVSGSTAVVGEISVKALEGAVAGGEDGEAAATVTIDLSGLPKGVTQAQLSKSSVDKLLAVVSDAGNAVESVTVNLGGAVLTLDAKALAAVAGQVKGGNVTLGVAESEADSLNSAQQQALSPFTVVQLYFEASIKSGGAEIHDFGGGSVLVSVAFEPRAGHDPARYVVLYVGEDGAIERYATAWADGMLSFTAPHFSAYAVVYVEDATQAAIDALTALPEADELKLDGAEVAVAQAQAALDALSKLDAGQRSLVDVALVANAEQVVARGTELIEEAERAAAEAAAKKAEADAKAVKKVKNKSFSVKAGKKKVIYFKTTSSSAGTKVTFAKTKGSKYISVTKAGKVTAKKGMKKGKTYTAKVMVTCGKAYKTVTITVKVR